MDIISGEPKPAQIDYEAEYRNLPMLPDNLPPTITEQYGDKYTFQEWFIPEALKIAGSDPGWLADITWWQNGSRSYYGKQVPHGLELVAQQFQEGKYNRRGIMESTLRELLQVGGPHFLPALSLRALEKLSPHHPDLESLWRGGTYRDGQSPHGLSGNEFSLFRDTAVTFITNAPRERPCILRLPVTSAVAAFRANKLQAGHDTANEKDVFGYSMLLSTTRRNDNIGIVAYKPPEIKTL